MTKPRSESAKFAAGDTVMNMMTEEKFVVGIRHFDPSDDCEYGATPGPRSRRK